MKPVDEYILEVLADEGPGTPKSISDEISRNNDYVGDRCRNLVDYGLLERVSVGLYRITNEGERFLSGDLDARELSKN